MSRAQTKSLFTVEMIVPVIGNAFRKLAPKQLIRNPVMFTTAVVAVLLTLLLVVGQDGLSLGFKLQLVVWLWLTVLFGTFAEARGAAEAEKRSPAAAVDQQRTGHGLSAEGAG